MVGVCLKPTTPTNPLPVYAPHTREAGGGISSKTLQGGGNWEELLGELSGIGGWDSIEGEPKLNPNNGNKGEPKRLLPLCRGKSPGMVSASDQAPSLHQHPP
eukprot:3035254-Amphidinium_carterae.1